MTTLKFLMEQVTMIDPLVDSVQLITNLREWFDQVEDGCLSDSKQVSKIKARVSWQVIME